MNFMSELNKIAKQMVAEKKGILAADESTPTIGKRLAKINIENTEDNRKAYRELLFTAPNIGEYISGVILYDETIRQRASDGHTFVTVLEKQGVLPGIKVDEGTEAVADSPDEVVTKGLEGLLERLPEYANMGAKFCKWRALIKIGAGIPTDKCIQINAERLAKYAKLCQQNNLAPIVEPEVLMDGDHTIEKCFEVTKKVLLTVFVELKKVGVAFDGMILKPNMIISGSECAKQASAKEVAEMTVKCLRETVPAEVPGIAFLSGGQSEEFACETLNEINKLSAGCPWQLSFSYGRALQASALKAWGGKSENVKVGQEAFLKQAKLVSLARDGKL
ncbi:MAG: fructose-bisphosphate aldolase [Candidatus Magasanikbacteria bacterium RIFCSPLOWO2_01_FULL_43_20b]|uniref:Probable fructose-bisphosphate aldolase class 1 n=1 Tax=Candidatus Magasanikbacteria bacterium RIFCSPLOWO2_12_FULL_43_12 TaxID=1798692 RepID=A0A1F6MV53_9BACT|nr:MAG: fructose-bisphosphate aldolase [Candidatus Magasanikbacteria bacterium RIFCSPLOWO2_02_FULL_43_22]OGH72045.1 MAG: fructose-bisphosphate aldolase [Candidatus Magasanikbacteria bacterium RIFCSPHIGHO2_02_FULL_44_13]OGH72997.1 MAG: fructose-bisphosphate aldolase [Candidatus Magasanikbacteria bacterium RIFCSPLOWO2_01_FULL_43_20b]OGH75576.1 MAG: fructose-bisphosphate aldolase [Candidatus Magasanikbacteria bacterium RIFCSPLOWO2_12_FULL_43_12]